MNQSSLLAALLLCLSCAHAGPPRGDAKASYDSFVDDYYSALFAFAPTQGTEVGLHQFDGAIDDLSAARIAARVAALEQLLSRFGLLERGALSLDDSVDSEALQLAIRAELFDLTQIRGWERNPMNYAG